MVSRLVETRASKQSTRRVLLRTHVYVHSRALPRHLHSCRTDLHGLLVGATPWSIALAAGLSLEATKKQVEGTHCPLPSTNCRTARPPLQLLQLLSTGNIPNSR